jgi:hypothetical protein
MRKLNLKEKYPSAFPELTPKHLKSVAEVAKCVTFCDGDILVRAGETGFRCHVIQKGKVEVIGTTGSETTGASLTDSPQWNLKRQPFLLETSRPGVFAAGDVRSLSSKRVSSAVGEGSMSVQFVHEYLREQSYSRSMLIPL